MAEFSGSLALYHEEPSTAPRRNAPVRSLGLWIAIRLSEYESPAPEALTSSLDALADWAFGFTPAVSMAPPHELLLEVGGSLKLFGGLEPLKRRMTAELLEHGLDFSLSASRTPIAASWLARYDARDALEDKDWVGSLSTLPLHVTRWPEDILILLYEMGVRSVGDCLRLPRDGFARRVGRPYLRDLDKALGREPDPRLPFEPRKAWASQIDFPLETIDRGVLAGAVETMIEHLFVSLRRRQSQIRGIELVFRHRRGAPTASHVEFIAPVHERRRLLEPIVARLETFKLPAAVTALGLRTDEMLPMQPGVPALFPELETANRAPREALIELLRGRFGQDSVYGIGLNAEHRPELVWRKLSECMPRAARNDVTVSPWAHERPLWILPRPLTLAEGASLLRLAGVLSRESEPERIESGWWDGADVRRDYYTAATGCGERLWIYQDRETDEWFLHGIFG